MTVLIKIAILVTLHEVAAWIVISKTSNMLSRARKMMKTKFKEDNSRGALGFFCGSSLLLAFSVLVIVGLYSPFKDSPAAAFVRLKYNLFFTGANIVLTILIVYSALTLFKWIMNGIYVLFQIIKPCKAHLDDLSDNGTDYHANEAKTLYEDADAYTGHLNNVNYLRHDENSGCGCCKSKLRFKSGSKIKHSYLKKKF